MINYYTNDKFINTISKLPYTNEQTKEKFEHFIDNIQYFDIDTAIAKIDDMPIDLSATDRLDLIFEELYTQNVENIFIYHDIIYVIDEYGALPTLTLSDKFYFKLISDLNSSIPSKSISNILQRFIERLSIEDPSKVLSKETIEKTHSFVTDYDIIHNYAKESNQLEMIKWVRLSQELYDGHSLPYLPYVRPIFS